jgi:hypothetical protein
LKVHTPHPSTSNGHRPQGAMGACMHGVMGGTRMLVRRPPSGERMGRDQPGPERSGPGQQGPARASKVRSGPARSGPGQNGLITQPTSERGPGPPWPRSQGSLRNQHAGCFPKRPARTRLTWRRRSEQG